MSADGVLSRSEVGQWVRTRELPPITKLILLLTFDHAGTDEDGQWVAWVGNSSLAQEAGLAEGANGSRTVRRHLADLELLGIVKREERFRRDGSQSSNRVVLLARAGCEDQGGGAGESGEAGLGSPPLKPQVKPQEKPIPGRAGARTDVRPVTFQGQTVPVEVVGAGERLLGVFASAAGRTISPRRGDGTASPALKQVVGALLAHPDVPEDTWAAAVRAAVAHPPDWVEGQLQTGHIFGEKASEWTLAAVTETGEARARQRRNGHWTAEDYIEAGRRAGEKAAAANDAVL
jgi:hypothetical protein